MELSNRKFTVVDWYDNEHQMTAKELYDRIMKDSKSDYNWITSAEELVRVTGRYSFPREYAYGIRMAILNCYANFEARKSKARDVRILRELEERAINICYNYISGSDERSIEVRHKYLKGLISAVSELHFEYWQFDHFGPTYHRLCEEWKKNKFEENKDCTSIEIKEFKVLLNDDFEQFMRKAEADGEFAEDDKKESEAQKRFFSTMFGHIEDIYNSNRR